MTALAPVPLTLAALHAPSGTLVVHAGLDRTADVVPLLLGAQAERVRSRRLPTGPGRVLRLARLAREARRTATPAVLVVHLTADTRFAADALLLGWARRFGMHVVAHLVDDRLDTMLLRADCPVTSAALRSDVVVVASARAAGIVHALLEDAPHAVTVVTLPRPWERTLVG